MNFIKENFVTILLVSLILIILLGLVFFIYKITIEDDNNNIEIAEIPEFIPIIDNNSMIDEEDNICPLYNASKYIIDLNKSFLMQKNVLLNKIRYVLTESRDNTKEIISSTTFDETDTQINDSTLSNIANTFNSCNASQKMRLQGYTMNAMATENKITVFSSGEGLNFNIEFILDNNILYTEIMYNETDPRITAIKVTLAVILVDCVGQVKGYPDGTLSTALGDEVAMNYTIENEGVEIKQLANGNDMVVKVDLNNNFSFLDI